MENRVGNVVPEEAAVEKLVQQVEAVGTKIEAFSVHLTSDERQRTLKMPGGGEEIAKQVAAMLRNHGVTLPNVSPDDIEADLLLAARLRPIAASIERVLRLVNDGILEADSEAWYGATAGYSTLMRLSGTDGKLATDLKPAMDFFGVGRKRKPRAPAPDK